MPRTGCPARLPTRAWPSAALPAATAPTRARPARCGARPDSFPGLTHPHALAQHPDVLAPLAAPDCAPVDRHPLVPCLAAFERFGAAGGRARFSDRSGSDAAPAPAAAARWAGPAPASEPIARNLALAHSLVRALAKPVAAPGTGAFAIKSASGQASEQQQLRALVHAIDADTDMALDEFHASRADLIEQQVGPEILARHDQAEAQLRIRAQTLRQRLRAWQSQPDEQNLGAIGQFFEQYPAARARSPLNPGELPWGTPRPTTAEPASSQAAWHQSLYADQKVLLAQAGTTIAGIRFDIPPAPGTAPDVADLAPTAEVTLSRAIQAKAAQLGNNPVLIDNWVRNTVEFLPTWGALQNADSTLQTLRGNAFDIASLHIALLRAAKIPARYQFGT